MRLKNCKRAPQSPSNVMHSLSWNVGTLPCGLLAEGHSEQLKAISLTSFHFWQPARAVSPLHAPHFPLISPCFVNLSVPSRKSHLPSFLYLSTRDDTNRHSWLLENLLPFLYPKLTTQARLLPDGVTQVPGIRPWVLLFKGWMCYSAYHLQSCSYSQSIFKDVRSMPLYHYLLLTLPCCA